jgi:hypothetical protein
MSEITKMNVEIDREIIGKGVNLLLANAFDNMQDKRDSWDSKNPFSKFLKEVAKENEDKIKAVLSEYIMEIVESEDFRLSVKSEYAKMLAKAMLKQVYKDVD